MTADTTVLQLVRQAVEQAHATGSPAPGRTKLARIIGATDYQVRRALATLAQAGEETSPAPASASPEPSDTGPEFEDLATAGEPLAEALAPAGETVASPSPAPASPTRQPRPWPLLVIGLAAAVAVWSGWVGLGQLAGFGLIQPLPGIWDDLRINTAVVLPISVEAYAAYALRCWLGGGQHSARTTSFARWSTIASLVIGAGAQVAYHLMAAAGMKQAPWQITMLVACVPVVVLGLASALAKLVTTDHQAGENR